LAGVVIIVKRRATLSDKFGMPTTYLGNSAVREGLFVLLIGGALVALGVHGLLRLS
jgi:hypothetical protein